MFKNLFFATLTLIVASPAFALEVGDNAPCVVLDHYQDGKESSHCIRDPQVAERPVILEFFSITCSDCLANLPTVKALSEDLEGKTTVRLISVDRNIPAVKDYIHDQKIGLEVAFDSQRDARTAYHVRATPTLYILDPKNVVIYKHVGILDAESYKEIIGLVEGFQK